MLDSKIQKIQSYEHIQVPEGSDKQDPTVYTYAGRFLKFNFHWMVWSVSKNFTYWYVFI